MKVLLLIRLMREKKLNLYISCLESLMFLFFALDHQNYIRWFSVHIRHLNTITCKQVEELSANWTIQKTKKFQIYRLTKYTIKKTTILQVKEESLVLLKIHPNFKMDELWFRDFEDCH